MKRSLKTLALLLMMPLLFAQCEKPVVPPAPDDPEPPVTNEKVTLNIYSPTTKTILEGDKLVLWENGEEIRVNDKVYALQISSGNREQATVEVDAADSYLAVSPANASYLLDNEYLYWIYGSTQSHREGSFASNANPMIAYSTNSDLKFHNLSGIIKLGIVGEGQIIKKLSITGNDNENLAGTLKYSLEKVYKSDFNEPIITNDYSSLSKTIEMTFGEMGMEIGIEPKYVYLVLPPATYSKGFTVTLEDSNGNTCFKSTDKSIELKRSAIVEMEEFEFTKAKEFTLDEVTSTANTVSYTVNAEPNSSIRTLLVFKSMWDGYLAGDYYTEENLPYDILEAYGETVTVDASGKYTTTETTAWNSSGQNILLLPNTDYKVITSYADGEKPIGAILVQDARTLEADGEEPEILLTMNETEQFSSSSFSLTVSENVVKILYIHTTAASWEAELADNATDFDVLGKLGRELPENYLAAAKGEGTLINFNSLNAATDYVFAIMALTDQGVAKVEKIAYTTKSYIDPYAQWELVSTNGYFDCGVFAIFGIRMPVSGLSIEKMVGEDFFRIKNLFSLENMPVLSDVYFSQREGDYYFYIDARDHNAVSVVPGANTQGIYNTYYADMDPIQIGTYHDYSPNNYPVTSAYSPDDGIISFGDLTFGSNGKFYGTESSTLYLYGYVEEIPGSYVTTENYTKDDTKTSW